MTPAGQGPPPPGGEAGPLVGTDAEALAAAVAPVVARLRRALRRAVRATAPDQPLRVAELEVLAAVVEESGVPPGEVARRLHLAPNSVSTLVRTLVAAGMVQRVLQAGDRRRARLLPTAHGRRTLRRWQRTNQQVLAVAMAALAPADRRTLAAAVGALDRLVDRIDTTAAGPTPPAPPAG